jgi:hypothetical protein
MRGGEEEEPVKGAEEEDGRDHNQSPNMVTQLQYSIQHVGTGQKR